MSDWQCAVDWPLAEYCRCRLWLDLRWCRWRVGAKDLCLAGQTIHPDCFSFPCSIGLDFSSVCKESNLRVNGSNHGCVDFPVVDRWIFVSFTNYFRRFFMRGLFLWFWGVWARIFWWESWIVASCIFVLDLDPPNSEFGLRLKDFSWTLGFWLSSVLIRFSAIYFVWGPKFWGIASTRDASHLPQIFPLELQPFGISMDEVVWLFRFQARAAVLWP
jgi:hypothetical protein